MKLSYFKWSLAIILASGAFSPAVAAGNTASTSGTAAATVVAPLVLTHTSGASLNFGKFIANTGGTVVISTAGVQSVTGGITVVSGGTPSADAFTVAGDTTRAYTISASSSITIASGANTLALTVTPSATTGTLVAGAGSFTVGGTLTVPSTAVSGTYTGSYTVTVTYS